MLSISLVLQLYLITPYYKCHSLTLVVLSFNYSMPLGAIYLNIFYIKYAPSI